MFYLNSYYHEDTALEESNETPTRPPHYCYSKRKRQHAQLPRRVSEAPSKKSTFLPFLENMKLDLKKKKDEEEEQTNKQTNANCSHIISNGFLRVSNCQI